MKDGELLGPVLAGRDAFGGGWIDGGVAEEAFEHEGGVLPGWVRGYGRTRCVTIP
jgi:hypothetical protein